LANIQYLKKQYKASQKTCLEFNTEFPNYEYWVAKAFILLADDYVKLKDTFQAKATLQSVIDNYKANDDILPAARQKMEQLSPGAAPGTATPPATKSDTTHLKKDKE